VDIAAPSACLALNAWQFENQTSIDEQDRRANISKQKLRGQEGEKTSEEKKTLLPVGYVIDLQRRADDCLKDNLRLPPKTNVHFYNHKGQGERKFSGGRKSRNPLHLKEETSPTCEDIYAVLFEKGRRKVWVNSKSLI